MEQDQSTSVIACSRCQLEVSVTTDDGGLKLAYDMNHWSKRCCCANRSSPVNCSSFQAPGSIVNELRSPKG